jgi:hypothetical protein
MDTVTLIKQGSGHARSSWTSRTFSGVAHARETLSFYDAHLLIIFLLDCRQTLSISLIVVIHVDVRLNVWMVTRTCNIHVT